MIYIEPSEVLTDPVDMHYIFEKYRKGKYIDFLGIYNSIVTDESYASYDNAFYSAYMPFVDPYELLKMDERVDLTKIINGQSKYLIRDLFNLRYPNLPVPEKNLMPRPVDVYLKIGLVLLDPNS